MSQLKSFFNFHGVTLEVHCQDGRHIPLLEWITEDFSFFSTAGAPSTLSDIKVALNPDLMEKVLFPFIKTRMCLSYGWFWQRVCFYDSSTILFQSFKKNHRSAVIKGSDTEFIYEIVYTYILSAVGEALEKKGLMRFHALGIEKNKKAKIYMLPSQGGKSSLAYQLINDSDLNVYSDEIVLSDGENVLPFPVRIALSETAFDEVAGKNSKEGKRVFKRRNFEKKLLIPLTTDRVAACHPLTAIYAPGFFYFIWSGFWGLGLPQMSEFFLRVPNTWGIIKMAFMRLKILTKILFSKRFKRLKKRRPGLKDIA